MAMFNSFPATYQTQYYQPSVQQAQAQQTQTSIIWVQGEAGAKSYLVAPNNTVPLWDSENPVIYLKSADVSGMPSMKILDYSVRGASVPENAVFNTDDKYVCKDELKAVRE